MVKRILACTAACCSLVITCLAWNALVETCDCVCILFMLFGVFGILGGICGMLEDTQVEEILSKIWANSDELEELGEEREAQEGGRHE